MEETQPIDVLALRKILFPYYMINQGFLRMVNSLQETARRHLTEVDKLCRRLARDYTVNINQKKEVIWDGWNAVLQEKFRRQGLDPRASLLVHRYWEYDFQSSFNIVFLVASGRYHSATREMRFVFESFVHAYCIDKTFPTLSLNEKLEELKKIQKNPEFRIKGRLFTQTFTKYCDSKELGKSMYKFYQELCGKVHPSYEELSHLRKTIEERGEEHSMGGLFSFYNKEDLSETLSTFHQLHEFVIKILEAV